VQQRLFALFIAVMIFLGVCAGVALADPSGEGEANEAPTLELTPQLIGEATGSPGVMGDEDTTNPEAAQQLPHHALDRSEALDLLSSVFGAAIESPAGIFDEMPPARFIGSHAAVMPAGSLVDGGGEETGASPESVPAATLVESSLPLRTENEEGREAPVNLSLERSEGELQPENPIVATAIPAELGEGVSLGNGTVELEFPEAAEERAPSTVEGDSAFYPNTEEDTDLVVAPIPGGVETMTQLRSAQAPRTQTIRLSLPEGAMLEATEPGGAEATLNGRTILNVVPPTAIDAAGNSVPMSLSVSGDQVELTVSPGPEASFPILADPLWLMENYNWTWGSSTMAGWTPSATAAGYKALAYGYPSTSTKDMDLTSGFNGGATPNTGAQWYYFVPRYQADLNTYGVSPQSYLEYADLEGAEFLLEGNHASDPIMIAGILDTENNQWVSVGSHTGAEGEISGWSGKYYFPNYANTQAKAFSFGLITRETEAQAKYRNAVSAEAFVEIADHNAPELHTVAGPSGWWNSGEAQIGYAVSDPGLGISGLELKPPGEKATEYHVGCVGGSANPCPREYKSEEAGAAKVAINATTAPEGRDGYTFAAFDPLYPAIDYQNCCEEKYPHIAKSEVLLKVDHSSPSVSLTGSATEQATLGTAKPQYVLKYSAADGSEEAPSFAASYGSAGTGTGQFTHPADASRAPDGSLWVADEINNRIEKLGEEGEFLAAYGTLGSGNGQLHWPTAIEVDSSGNVWVVDSGNNRVEEFNEKGEYVRKFGTTGTGNGQLSAPKGLALGSNGNVWVADTGNNRVEEFTATGTFVAAFGSKGSGNGQFNEPAALDIGPGGNVWVADEANNRIEELSEKGEFLAAYGSIGSGNGQLSAPNAIDVDTRGSVWVVDKSNNRVEQFSERGEYLGQFGSKGTGSGQFTFTDPTGITSSSTGALWVVDSGNNRIEQFTSPKGTRSGVRSVSVKVDGKSVQQGSVTCPEGGCPMAGEWTLHSGEYAPGSHTVEVTATDGVELSKTEKLNITLNPPAPSLSLSGTMTEQASLGTQRPRYKLKLSASAEEGTGSAPAAPTYSSSFGSTGAGEGQFSHPAGIAPDSTGKLWVADVSNNRIEGFKPSGEFVKAVGSTGSGSGQFSKPKAIAIDPKGNFWVADSGNNRLEEFNSNWEFVKTVGSLGSGNGQFNGPEGLAIDSHGHIWVADTYNHRVQELNEKGEFLQIVAGLGSIEPTAVAIGPSGYVWITDWSHNRIVELSEAGTLLQSFGSEGAGFGQFKHPDAVGVDSNGNVWVGDQNNARVQEFNQSGEYLAQFGSAGTGPGQFSFSYPMGIVADSSGNIWVSDTCNNRVQRWHQPGRSTVATEISIDGKQVDTAEALCVTETCPITREWTLESPAYSAGAHTVVVKATDRYGYTTTKTLSVQIQRDTTKPEVQLSGELAEAPEGWVQQEGYGFFASASDGGYGLASLTFSIDGSEIASKTNTCPEGGCGNFLSRSVNMAPYSGGAHEAEVVATDGAGNKTARRWTINVDPEGHISTAEASATLEAAEATGAANVVGEAREEPGIEGSAPGLGLETTESGYVATGGAAPTTISAEPGGPMQVEIPEAAELISCRSEPEALTSEEGTSNEEAIGCEPVAQENGGQPFIVEIEALNTSENAATPELIEGNATLTANSQGSADTTIRPLSDGGMIFQTIRDESAPEEYSYRVKLGEEQELRKVSDTTVEVYYSSGEAAFAINAEPASDAVGTTVPTTLRKTAEDVVTLTVHYKTGAEGQPFVYPIVAGSGWEGGFRTINVEMDNSSGEETGGEAEEFFVSAPEPPTPEEAAEAESDSGEVEPLALLDHQPGKTKMHEFTYIRCHERFVLVDPTEPKPRLGETNCGDPFKREYGSDNVVYSFGIRGRFYVNPGDWVSHIGTPWNGIECAKMTYGVNFGGLAENEYFINNAEPCQWWPKNNHNGGKRVIPEHHLTAFGKWKTGEGHPGGWNTAYKGSAVFVYATPGGYKVNEHPAACAEC
jgi:sugar lactone lactonase YvrE